MSDTDRMIYGGKCRCCQTIEVWDFGEASDKQEQLLNMYINDKHSSYCKTAVFSVYTTCDVVNV